MKKIALSKTIKIVTGAQLRPIVERQLEVKSEKLKIQSALWNSW
jgi:hypothetical protein